MIFIHQLTIFVRRWESLEEQPAEGQWKYFERKAA